MATLPVLKAIEQQDASRLPCGSLERYVFSTDRRKLLSPPIVDDNKNDNNTAQQTKTTFVAGSEDEYYYTMLQIENEIQKESLKNKDKNKVNLNKLQNEFNKWVKKANNKWNIIRSSRIQNIIFRNKMRDIMNDDINKQSDSIKKLNETISINKTFVKPSDVSSGIFSSKNTVRNHKCFISAIDLKKKLNKQLRGSLTGYNKNNLSNYYHNLSLPWLVKQNKLTTKQKQSLINSFYTKLTLINEDKLLQFIVDDINSNSKNYIHFGNRTIHSLLTRKQMNKLKIMKPELLNNKEFIEIYLKKIMPLSLGIYIGKSWNDGCIPLKEKWKYIKALYDYSNSNDLDNYYSSNSNSIRCYILYQYQIFIEQNYYILNKSIC